MGFLRTAEEVKEITAFFARQKFLYEGVKLEFTTTDEFIDSVLPPGFSRADSPTGLISIGRWQSAFAGEFDTASTFIKARFGDIVGYYNLSMLVSGEMPVTLGREILGEVKKHGRIGVHADEHRYYAYVERNGVRLIEIDAELTMEAHDVDAKGLALEVKAFPSANGLSLENDPVVVVYESEAHYSRMLEGTGRLTLRGTAHDPLDTIPIASVGKATFSVGVSEYFWSQTLPMSCSRAEYLPYLYGRHYDNLGVLPKASRYRQ